MTPSPVQSTPEIEKRLPFDPNAAKKLLADAGYPNGFEVQLDCPNNRYVNDEKICQALAAMWAKIGVDTKLVNAMPRAQYFPKLEKTRHQHLHAGLGRRVDRRDLHAAAGAVDATTARATATSTTAATRTPKFDELVAEDQGRDERGEARSALIRDALLDAQRRDPPRCRCTGR